MSRKKKPLPILENITIEDFAAEGKCVARVNDKVVFAQYCVPGDVVDLQVRRKKHSYCEAEVINIHEYSTMRETPRCSHFGICGGCKWQNVRYEEQLKFKQTQVEQQLRRIGKIELPDISPILGSKNIWEYRNKLDFGCSNKRWLTREQVESQETFDNMNAIGFHITGAFDKILPIERCHLMNERHNARRNGIRDYAYSTGMSFFDLRQQTGMLRDIVIRCSNSGEWMVVIQFHFDHSSQETLNKSKDEAIRLLDHLAESFPEISSLMYVDNQKCNDTFGDLEVIPYKGTDHIFLLMENLRFKVGPKSFYQTNTEQAYQLYCVARKLAFQGYDNGAEKPLVYDLYTGTGTIANFVAARCSKVVGIEYVPEAIEDAKVNSDINGIGNTVFFAGDMKDILTDDFINIHGRPDIIITDPPRAGMHTDVVKTILNAAPEVIVYVSCNPATQARDLALLDEAYKVTDVQPVDMFPHTPHVENVVRLVRKTGY